MISKLAIEEMEALRRLALEITSELDRDKLLHTIIRSVVELLQASGGGIYEYRPDKKLLRVVADWGGPSIVGHTLEVGQGLAGQVLKKRKAMAVDDYRTWPGRSPHLEPDLFKAVAADLLKAPGGRILGVLYVTDNVEGRTFSKRDASLLGLLAGHAAIAMRNAEVLADKQLSLTQLELINKFDESIREALNLKELLQKTLKEALRAVRADEGSVMILDHEKNILEIRAWIVRGQYTEKEHPVFTLSQGIAGHVAATGREHYCPDTSKDKYYQDSFTGRRIQSILSVPIISRGLVLGVVSADSEGLNAFNEHDLEMLKTLASHVAQAIESQLFRDVAISLSTLPEEEMYKSIVKNACILSGTEVSTIFLREGDAVRRRAVFSLMPLVASGTVRESGITQRILATGKPEIINDAQNHPDVKPSMKQRGIKSVMGVPLNVRLGDEGDSPIVTIGVLYVSSSTRRREFGERDREILQSLASQAAIAITKARFNEEAGRERDSARWLNSQLLTLYSITEEMQSEPDLSRLLNLISEKAAKLLGGDASGILLMEPGGGRLSFKGSYGLSDEFLAAIHNAEGGTLVADDVVENRSARIVNHLEGDKRFVSQASRAENIKAVISTPLLIKNKIIGTLDIHSKTRADAFDDQALRILSLLANQAALAIENTRVSHFQQSLLSSAFDAIIAVSATGVVREFNDSAQRILGYTRAETVDAKMPVSNLFYRPEDAEYIAGRLEDSATGGRIQDINTFARDKSGDLIPVLLSVCRLESGGVGFFRDERKIERALQYIQQLKDMLKAVLAITELTEVQRVLDTTVEKTKEILSADLVSLYLYDEDADEIQLQHACAGDSPHEDSDGHTGSDSVPWRIIRHGETHYSVDAQHDPLVIGDYVKQEDILSCVACPLKFGRKIVGVLFCNYKAPHFFDDRERAIIDLFTSVVATALENARLFKESVQLNEQLESLYKASLGLTANLSTEDILQTLVDSARASTGAEYTALGILTPNRELNPFVVSGFDSEEAALISHPPVGKGVLGALLKQGEVINLPDVAAHPDYAGQIPEPHPHITSFLGVPIVSRDTVIGDLYAANKKNASTFSQEDVAHLKLLALQAGVLMERTASQEAARAEQTMNISFLLLSRWALTVWKAKSALEEGIGLIERSLGDESRDVILETLRGMSESLRDIEGPQQSLQLELHDNRTETVNLSQLLRKVAARPEIARRIQNTPQLAILPLCMVTGNELLLEFALNIIINNAAEAIELKGCPGEMKVSCAPDGKLVQVHIADTGAGIPPSVRGKLYREPLRGGEGTGYGSLAAGMILKVHGGNIRIIDTDDGVTEINFWLPAAAQ